MTIRIVSASAGPVRWSLVTTVAAALAVLAMTAVYAQAPAQAPAAPAPKKPEPKPKTPAAAPKQPAAQPAQAPQQQPAAPQQQAAGPPPAQMPNFVYSPWTKF